MECCFIEATAEGFGFLLTEYLISPIFAKHLVDSLDGVRVDVIFLLLENVDVDLLRLDIGVLIIAKGVRGLIASVSRRY